MPEVTMIPDSATASADAGSRWFSISPSGLHHRTPV
jgi:hypothetical protein